MRPSLHGYHIHFDELVAENTISMRKATYEAIIKPKEEPDPENPATEIHEDDEQPA